jgi:hypothetical protein
MYRFVVSAGIALVASLSVMVVPVSAAPAPPSKLILALDACDAVTFNAALGAGTCSRPGMPLNVFLAQVQQLHQAPAWRFAPGSVSVVPNQPVVVKNMGAEAHTFTEVAHFGGGFVPELNQLAGNLTPVAECSPGNPELNLMAAGGSVTETESAPGPTLYMCCIHPWMHAVINVSRFERPLPGATRSSTRTRPPDKQNG